MTRLVDSLLLPCEHPICAQCAPQLPNRTCNTCGKPVTGHKRSYI